ncbi:MAG: hypothetical protein A2289_09170 [Deltaproteobacteria bacterium RIFOXYA12_FULL_58_15]|nr:MAG: hypothetical protein A2289_09170 [Deltaproteobacteria bacterium RIFOXYA12_FULL_58_15]
MSLANGYEYVKLPSALQWKGMCAIHVSATSGVLSVDKAKELRSIDNWFELTHVWEKIAKCGGLENAPYIPLRSKQLLRFADMKHYTKQTKQSETEQILRFANPEQAYDRLLILLRPGSPPKMATMDQRPQTTEWVLAQIGKALHPTVTVLNESAVALTGARGNGVDLLTFGVSNGSYTRYIVLGQTPKGWVKLHVEVPL